MLYKGIRVTHHLVQKTDMDKLYLRNWAKIALSRCLTRDLIKQCPPLYDVWTYPLN